MPKAREQFAEFLDQDSLERFSILYLTTSVGLRYGRSAPSQRSFSRHEDQPHANPEGPAASHLSLLRDGFAYPAAYLLARP